MGLYDEPSHLDPPIRMFAMAAIVGGLSILADATLSNAREKSEACNDMVKTMTPDLRADFAALTGTLQDHADTKLDSMDIEFRAETAYGTAECTATLTGP